MARIIMTGFHMIPEKRDFDDVYVNSEEEETESVTIQQDENFVKIGFEDWADFQRAIAQLNFDNLSEE